MGWSHDLQAAIEANDDGAADGALRHAPPAVAAAVLAQRPIPPWPEVLDRTVEAVGSDHELATLARAGAAQAAADVSALRSAHEAIRNPLLEAPLRLNLVASLLDVGDAEAARRFLHDDDDEEARLACLVALECWDDAAQLVPPSSRAAPWIALQQGELERAEALFRAIGPLGEVGLGWVSLRRSDFEGARRGSRHATFDPLGKRLEQASDERDPAAACPLGMMTGLCPTFEPPRLTDDLALGLWRATPEPAKMRREALLTLYFEVERLADRVPEVLLETDPLDDEAWTLALSCAARRGQLRDTLERIPAGVEVVPGLGLEEAAGLLIGADLAEAGLPLPLEQGCAEVDALLERMPTLQSLAWQRMCITASDADIAVELADVSDLDPHLALRFHMDAERLSGAPAPRPDATADHPLAAFFARWIYELDGTRRVSLPLAALIEAVPLLEAHGELDVPVNGRPALGELIEACRPHAHRTWLHGRMTSDDPMPYLDELYTERTAAIEDLARGADQVMLSYGGRLFAWWD